MLQVKAGQLAAMRALFERHRRPLLGFLLRMCKQRALSEDLLQMTFERMIRYRQSYREGKSFRSWMYQIARNLWLDHCKEKKLPIDDQVDFKLLPLFSPAVDVALEKREQLRILEEAVIRLKPSYREVLLLVWKEQMPYAEVGAVLGISESNVKVRMHRALQQLKRWHQTQK